MSKRQQPASIQKKLLCGARKASFYWITGNFPYVPEAWVDSLNLAEIIMEYTNEIPRSNQLKLRYILYGLLAFLFIYGCFLPENWRVSFGIFAWPIAFAADNVPAIRKAIVTAQAVRPELGYGFLGMAAYIPIIYALCFAWYGFFDRSDPNNVHLIVGIRGVRRVGGKVKKLDGEKVPVFYNYSGSRARFLHFNSYEELNLTDKIFFVSAMLFLIIGTYIYPFGDWLNAHGAKIKPFCQFVGEPMLDTIICVFLGVAWTANIAGVVVDLMAFIVDMVIDNKQ